MSSRSSAVSRTSSVSSVEYSANTFNAAEQRRTRKRITAAQLVQLEELYYRSSHPTRDQRDALAKRIQMETKSVTIWFQNKRQTDRKVALHNATNSRNASNNPNITLTAPTSPACPPEASIPQEGGVPKLPSERMARRPSVTRSNPLKRVPSNASSHSSSHASSGASTSSSSSTSRAKPSLDRIASRSEIRFTDRASLSRSASCAATGDGGVDTLVPSTPSIHSVGSAIARSDSSVSVPPASPLPAGDPPLWSNMLSSPITPSSPPSAEFVAYTRARKTRTLDWACAAARLARGVAFPQYPPMDVAAPTPHGPPPLSALAPAVSISCKNMETCEREYEEATAMTEDEAELVTPHGSQDTSMPWAGDHGDAKSVGPATEAMRAVGLMRETSGTDVMVVDEQGWEEDEMHAALVLCGLRG